MNRIANWFRSQRPSNKWQDEPATNADDVYVATGEAEAVRHSSIQWSEPINKAREGVQYVDQYGRPNLVRTAIARILEEMFESEIEGSRGIYQTSRFMDRIEALLESMMAAPEAMCLSGSEAVYGFAAWLSAKDEMLDGTELDDCARWAQWAKEFCVTNNLPPTREEWAQLLAHPT